MRLNGARRACRRLEAAQPDGHLRRHRPCRAGHLIPRGRGPRSSSPGSELVRGERTDLNGPFLAAQALALGLEPARITIVGDRPDELEAALSEGLAAELCLVSGGLGPTHDDRTVELVAKAAGRELVLDEALHERDRRRLAADRRAAPPAVRRLRAGRAQAGDPAGGGDLARTGGNGAGDRARHRPRRRRRLARTARGAAAALAARAGDRAGAARAGPRAAARDGGCCASTARASRRSRRRSPTPAATGTGWRRRSALASSRSTSTCSSSRARRSVREALERALAEPLAQYLFARDERPVEAIVLDLCRARGWTLGDGRVVHGRPRRGAADVGPGLERRLPGRQSSPTRTR